MIEVKEIITVFCKCLHDTIESPLTPEHLRNAKYDKTEGDVMKAFWDTLEKLSYFTVKEENNEISFCNFDRITKTKLRMAYLQYPAVEFYNLPETPTNSGSRALLLALVWLITKHDALKNVVRLKVINSPLGREFSKVSTESKNESYDADLSTVEKQVNSILHKSHKLGCNLKAISELHVEKVKLTTRVHAASLTTCGLPHLTVSEMSLVKMLNTGKMNSKKECKQLQEMEKAAMMLDTYMKWTKKNAIFYTWMNTVIDESEKEELVDTDDLIELSKFIYILRFLVRKRIKSFKNMNDDTAVVLLPSCSSRFIRTQKGLTEVQKTLTEFKSEWDCVDKTLEKRRKELTIQLQSLFDLFPNFYQI